MADVKPRPRAMDIIRAQEDQKVFDILDRLSLCQECYGVSPGGLAFGCDSCILWVARNVMES